MPPTFISCLFRIYTLLSSTLLVYSLSDYRCAITDCARAQRKASIISRYHYLWCSCPCALQKYPPKRGCVRGISYVTGFLLRGWPDPRAKNPRQCQFTYLTHGDPRGASVPYSPTPYSSHASGLHLTPHTSASYAFAAHSYASIDPPTASQYQTYRYFDIDHTLSASF